MFNKTIALFRMGFILLSYAVRVHLSRAERVRLILQHSGPVFIKLGQALSTRRDVLPSSMIASLSQLRDQVKPISPKKMIDAVELALEKPIAEVFHTFDAVPLASASIAQVHAATLLNGEAVVVKVLKPKIQAYIARDIVLLELLARFLERWVKKSRRIKPIALVNELKRALYQELDLRMEANYASMLREKAASIPQCYIPNIDMRHCYESLFVMERIAGVSIDDVEKLRSYGVDLTSLANTCVEVLFTQIFRDRLFHADLHPGNVFVDVTVPQCPVLQLIDFGIVGELSRQDHRYIAENMMAVVHRDFMKSAQLHREAGWIPACIPLETFAQAMSDIFSPLLDCPIKDNTFGDMLNALIQVSRRFHLDVQPQLLLLQKTLFSIDGLCRQLAPEMSLYRVAQPIIERWVRYHRGPLALLREIKERLPEVCEFIRRYL